MGTEDPIRRQQRGPVMPSRMLHVRLGGGTGEAARCKTGIVVDVTPDNLIVKVLGLHGDGEPTKGLTFCWRRGHGDEVQVLDYGAPYDLRRAVYHWPQDCDREWPDW